MYNIPDYPIDLSATPLDTLRGVRADLCREIYATTKASTLGPLFAQRDLIDLELRRRHVSTKQEGLGAVREP